jgi:hypothetical protein
MNLSRARRELRAYIFGELGVLRAPGQLLQALRDQRARLVQNRYYRTGAEVLKRLSTSETLRQDLISKAEAAMREMNAHNWGNAVNRATEMNFLIKALRRMK